MNYKKHYDLLIEKSNSRKIEGYLEEHHIIPKCLGGTNKKENLVEQKVIFSLITKYYIKKRKIFKI